MTGLQSIFLQKYTMNQHKMNIFLSLTKHLLLFRKSISKNIWLIKKNKETSILNRNNDITSSLKKASTLQKYNSLLLSLSHHKAHYASSLVYNAFSHNAQSVCHISHIFSQGPQCGKINFCNPSGIFTRAIQRSKGTERMQLVW